MAQELSIDQARRRIEGLSKSIDNFGLTPPFRKIGKYLRKKSVSNVRKGRSPRGIKWQDTFFKPLEKVGHKDPVEMIVGHNKVITQKIRSKKGKKARKKFREKFGPPLKKMKALHRGGKFSTKKRIAEFLNTPGRALRFGKWEFEYGFTPGTRWIEQLQFGGVYKGGKVPKRTILELTFLDRKFISETVGDFVDMKLAKLARR